MKVIEAASLRGRTSSGSPAVCQGVQPATRRHRKAQSSSKMVPGTGFSRKPTSQDITLIPQRFPEFRRTVHVQSLHPAKHRNNLILHPTLKHPCTCLTAYVRKLPEKSNRLRLPLSHRSHRDSHFRESKDRLRHITMTFLHLCSQSVRT